MKQVIEFRHQYSESLLKGSFEVFTKPSETEPENSLSIPEIIAKFTRGLPAEIRQYQWSSGVSVPEDGETYADDGSLESVLEVPVHDPEPKQDSEPNQDPELKQDPAQ